LAKKGRGEEVVLDHPCLVDVPAAERELTRRAWKRRAALFLQPFKATQHCFEFFGGLFCKF
jgi:hypothetical protein